MALSNDEIKDLMSKTKEAQKPMEETTTTIVNSKESNATTAAVSRNLLVIGCGDGGCNIASTIRDRIPDVRVIAYNTSRRAMDSIHADVRVIPPAEDGSGKVREYSQDVFKKGSHKHILHYVNDFITNIPNLEYIVVTSSCDGGTGGGISPRMAKFIADNVDIPVIIIGVYPSINEDSMSQYNTLMWQTEVEKTGLPYMVFDNDGYTGPKNYVHRMVNEDIADAMEVLTGAVYGDTNIQAIDNRDMLMMIQNVGGRICIYTDDSRPKVNDTLDGYLTALITNTTEPAPEGMRAVGLFLKGGDDLVNNTDTSLIKVRQQFGNADLMYTHLEISNETRISLIATGCASPSQRLAQMRQRYDDIRNTEKVSHDTASDIVKGMENPLGKMKTKSASTETDFSALDL